MSNQEAIALLRNLEDSLDAYCELNEEGKTAFRMAITALEVFGISEQLPSAQPKERTEERMETHACDLIDRQAAIKALPSAQPNLDEWCTDCKEYDHEKHCCPRFNRVIRDTLNEVEPMRKRGTWMHDKDDVLISGYCSCCGWESIIMETDVADMPFCPNCGADMRGEGS